jgi:hypothetical protein
VNADRLIITAASAAFGPSLLGLIGSLNLNWQDHPPLLVYDIGLDDSTLKKLEDHNIAVEKVPEFCPHWRLHFTWKLWCLVNAPAENVLWLDAGNCILQPLFEVFDALDERGYFLVENGQLLDYEASEAACRGCRVQREAVRGKPTLAGGFMGYRKTGLVMRILEEALSVAMLEEHIAANDYRHRHDQAIISLLFYKYIPDVVTPEARPYLNGCPPGQATGQKVWLHRRQMSSADTSHFASHLTGPGKAYLPIHPVRADTESVFRRLLVRAKRVVRQSVRVLLLRPTQQNSGPKIYNGIRD